MMTDFKEIEVLKEKVAFLEHHNRRRLLREYIKSSIQEIENYLTRENGFTEIEGTCESVIKQIEIYNGKEQKE